MRRRDPRPLGAALASVVEELAPATTLARVQTVWPAVAGEVIAHEAAPVSEREGVVTVECSSSVWAQEIELLSGDLVARLNEALGGATDAPPVRSLRVSAARRRRAVT
jgi:predicted nucleic acid-binding Zn ribbon protein